MASGSRRARQTAAALAALAALVLLAGCEFGGDGDSASNPFEPASTPSADVKPAQHNAERLWALVVGGTDRYRLVLMAGATERASFTSERYLEQVFFTADGRFVVAHTHPDNDAPLDAGDLVVLEVATGEGRIESCGNCHAAAPYRGSTVVFATGPEEGARLQTLDLGRAGAVPEPAPGPEEEWTPGGAAAVAARSGTTLVSVYRTEPGVDRLGRLIRADGSSVEADMGSRFSPMPGTYSPDGSTIALPAAYSCEGDAPAGYSQVLLVDATSGQATPLPNPPGASPSVLDVVWSPNGTLYAVFLSEACDFQSEAPVLWRWSGGTWVRAGDGLWGIGALDGTTAVVEMPEPGSDFGRRIVLRSASGDQTLHSGTIGFALPGLESELPDVDLGALAQGPPRSSSSPGSGGAACEETALRAATTPDGGIPLRAPAGSGTGFFYDGFSLLSCGPSYALFEASRSSGSVLTYWLAAATDGRWVIRVVNTVRVSDYESTDALFSCEQLDDAGIDAAAAAEDVRSRYTEHALCDEAEPALPEWLAEVQRAESSSYDDALAWLRRIAAEDADDLATIPEGTWVPQVSGKCAVLPAADFRDAQGTSRWDGREEPYPDGIGHPRILGFHLTLRHDFDRVLLTTYDALVGPVTGGQCEGETVWISLVSSVQAEDADTILEWCDEQRAPLRECGARQISRTNDSEYRSREG